MRRQIWLACVLVTLLWAAPAKADNVIVRTTNLQALQAACNPPLLPPICTVVGGLGDPLGQVFLVTSPLPLQNLLGLLEPLAGFVSAELDQLLSLVGGLNVVPTTVCGTAGCDPTLMSDRTPVVYPAGSSTTAWNSYVNQPAAGVVEVQTAQSTFHVTGTGIVADIDTGVDPNHPVLQGVLLAGYDFTRNQPGGSEMNDVSSVPPPSCTTTCPGPAQVNQSTSAVEVIQIGRNGEAVGYFTGDLLRGAARQRQRHQHEFRNEDFVYGIEERTRLCEPARSDVRGFRRKRWRAGDCVSCGA